MASRANTLPAEWEPHECCWMSWPAVSQWGARTEAARAEISAIASAISESEEVRMLVYQPSGADLEVIRHIPATVAEIEQETHVWTRDNLPTFVRTPMHLRPVLWKWTGWGGHYPDDTNLDTWPDGVRSCIEIEGGNITSDGTGTAIISRSATFTRRNERSNLADVDVMLKATLGLERIVWLPGNPADTATDGHVDGICAFAGERTVICEIMADAHDPEYLYLYECYRNLCQDFEVRTLHRPDRARLGDVAEDFCSCYVNFYIANGAVIMPAVGLRDADAAARAVIEDAFPGRKVVQMRIDTIASQGGGIHCVTHEQPTWSAS